MARSWAAFRWPLWLVGILLVQYAVMPVLHASAHACATDCQSKATKGERDCPYLVVEQTLAAELASHSPDPSCPIIDIVPATVVDTPTPVERAREASSRGPPAFA